LDEYCLDLKRESMPEMMAKAGLLSRFRRDGERRRWPPRKTTTPTGWPIFAASIA
jgi:hypothetical protein